MQNYKSKLKNVLKWIENNKIETALLFTILLIAAFFRLWRIDEYLTFLGDEGRDVRVVRRLLTEFDLIFVGPRTSIGDMYLGPLYYYLIAPFLWLWRFSPAGPAVFVAFLGVATVALVWHVARVWFGKIAGLTASFLFATSPVVISLSKHSWNPNIMPFFSLLAIYGLWRVWQKRQFWWLVVVGASFAFVLQSHYLGLLLLPIVGLFWLLTLRLVWKSFKERLYVLRFTFYALAIFAILMSPLFIFDAKHGWRNIASMKTFFAERQTTVSAKPWNAIPQLWPLWNEQLTSRLLAGKNRAAGKWLGLVAVAGIAWVGYRFYKTRDLRLPNLMFLGTWTLVGLVGLGLYKQHIYDHYLGFMFAAPFLLVGVAFQELWNTKCPPRLGVFGEAGKVVVLALLLILAWINLQENPLKYPPNRQMQRVQELDRRIIREAAGQPFNFALIAERNYEEGHLYFFELWGARVSQIDPQRYGETRTSQLFVVCEDQKKPDEPDPCNPINHRKAEIANFGWSKIEDSWEIAGVKLFKLVLAKQEGQ